jgi:hypothetical protein
MGGEAALFHWPSNKSAVCRQPSGVRFDRRYDVDKNTLWIGYNKMALAKDLIAQGLNDRDAGGMQSAVFNSGILDIERQHDVLRCAASLRWDRIVIWNYEGDFERVISASAQVDVPVARKHTRET